MKITFDTALFGERDKAHSILASSQPTIARTLVAVSDLPLDLPGSSGNSPMLSGFQHDGKYVFLSSIRDPNASRGGMAKTVALFTDLKMVDEVHSLDAIFQHLDHNAETFVNAGTIPIDVSENGPTVTPVETLGLVRALIARGTSQPVVWVGEEGHRSALVGLWRALPPLLRRRFAFRFSCTPRDGRIKDADLLLTPVQYRSRWKGLVVVDSSFRSPESQTEKYFVDDAIRQSVLTFSRELSVDIATFETLSLVADTQDLFQRIKYISDLEVTVLLRNVARLSPTPLLGERIKKRTVNELCARIESGPIEIIGYLRNVQGAEFPDGFNAIRQATRRRWERSIISGDRGQLELILQALVDNSRPWALGVLQAFEDAVHAADPGALQLLWWLLLGHDHASINSWIANVAKTSPHFEQALADSIPQVITQIECQTVARHCKQQRWAKLHAIAVTSPNSSLTPRDAIAQQLYFAKFAESGIGQLSRGLGPRIFVENAMASDRTESLLAQVIVDCRNNIELLDMCCVNDANWRHVLRAVVEIVPESFDGSNALDSTITGLWKTIVEGAIKDDELIEAICRTRYANLLEIEVRQDIWGKLPHSSRPRFLNATAIAWIDCVRSKGFDLERPEPALSLEILAHRHRAKLLPVAGDDSVVLGLRAFHTFHELTQSDFDDWRIRLLTAHRNLPEVSAQLIGAYIARKNWRTCANGLLSDYYSYSRFDLFPALRECAGLFGWLTRFKLSLSNEPPTTEQWWLELENRLLHLYPEGPLSKAIWERASGHVGDLQLNVTGREQWSRLVEDLREGKELRGATIRSLLIECLNDYPTNEDLQLLMEKAPPAFQGLTDNAFND